METEAIMCKVT